MQESSLTNLERRFIDAVRGGEDCVVLNGQVPPDTDDPNHTIRGAVVQALVDGTFGGAQIGRFGIRLRGARITGDLNLSDITISYPLTFYACRFTGRPTFDRSRLPAFSASNSHFQSGFSANDCSITSDFGLNGITAHGKVEIIGADIGGQLLMKGATLDAGQDGRAFNGQGLRATQDVFMDSLRATGTVALTSANIGGQLVMNGATLDAGQDGLAFNGQGLRATQNVFMNELIATGAVYLFGARIGGSFEVVGATLKRPGGVALNLEKSTLARAFFLGLAGACVGRCNLSDARIDTLLLNPMGEGWPRGLKVVAPGIQIGSLPGYQRGRRDGWIKWLDAQDPWSPHAYQQVAARLRDGGHEACAKAVYIAMRRRQRREEHSSFVAAIPEKYRNIRFNGYFPERIFEWIGRHFDALVLDGLIGYGYKPMRAVGFMGGLILFGMVVFQQAWDARLMAPAQATIFEGISEDAPQSHGTWGEGFYLCALDNPPLTTALTRRSPAEENCLPSDYPSFIPLFYSFDLAIPLLEMRPERFWTINSTPPWGWLVLCWYYAQIILGSLLTGLFLAAVTGIIKRE
jgi:hypothetical protein